MRLPFALELPAKLQVFSVEFMAAFDAEADDISPDTAARAPDAINAAPPAVQGKSIASAAADTAAFIASSLRALAPSPACTNPHPHSPQQPPPHTRAVKTEDDLEECIRSADLQSSVDRELAAYSRFTPAAALAAASSSLAAASRQAADALSRNFVRVSFGLLVFGMILLLFA